MCLEVDKLDIIYSQHPKSVTRNSYNRASHELEVIQNSPLTQVLPPSELLQRGHHIIQAKATEANIDLPLTSYSVAFPGVRYFPGIDMDMIINSLADDIVYQRGNQRLIAPPDALRKLDALDRIGLGELPLYIVHDIPKGIIRGTPGQELSPNELPLEYLVPPLPEKAEKRRQDLHGIHKLIQKSLGMTAKGIAVGVAGATALAALPVAGLLGASTAVGLDPTLLLCLPDTTQLVNGLHPSYFYHIFSWDW